MSNVAKVSTLGWYCCDPKPSCCDPQPDVATRNHHCFDPQHVTSVQIWKEKRIRKEFKHGKSRILESKQTWKHSIPSILYLSYVSLLSFLPCFSFLSSFGALLFHLSLFKAIQSNLRGGYPPVTSTPDSRF